MTLRHAALILFICLPVIAAAGGAFAQSEGPGPAAPGASQVALGPGFSYNGRLFSGGAGVTGECDFQFGLWDALTGGGQLGLTQTVSSVTVNAGLFTVTLNAFAEFGGSAFDGDARWLAIALRCPAGGGAYTPLTPRQALLAAPYALHALTAGSADAALSALSANSVPWSGITGLPAGFADGVDNVGGSDAAWQLSGNAGTTRSQFVGTTDNMTLTLVVSGTTALRLGPSGGAPNLIGGHISNTVGAGVVGAVIAGGGGPTPNQVSANHGTVGGGTGNTASGQNATVSGGQGNTASGLHATAGGGQLNLASGLAPTVAGGQLNIADDDYATVGGGQANLASRTYATVGGGDDNAASGYAATVGGGGGNAASWEYATVGGGLDNTASDWYATVGGGWDNTASNLYATVGGGQLNLAGGPGATVGGGDGNTASGFRATVGGGQGSTASGYAATVGGGEGNTASSLYATVGGGFDNTAAFSGTTVSGGQGNTATGLYATVAGGQLNLASALAAVAAGGQLNLASGEFATVGGGQLNNASHDYATVGGGDGNTASGGLATVSGGGDNTASGPGATVPGGSNNVASGAHSLAAGFRAEAVHNGTFVWSSIQPTPITSTSHNQFLVRATGGISLTTNGSGTTGCNLSAGGGTWNCTSDRNAKANFAPVDGVAILNTLAGLPIETWNFNSQDASIRHMGPMAQEWYAAFGLGEGATTISAVDADGVALAAIQGLYSLVQEQAARIAALEAALESSAAVETSRRDVSTGAALPWLLLAGLGLLNAGGAAGYALARRRRP